MATEAGILGTPSVYISSLVGTMGNFEELEAKYGLVYSFSDFSEALRQCIVILSNNKAKKECHSKRNNLLVSKINVTDYIIQFLEKWRCSRY